MSTIVSVDIYGKVEVVKTYSSMKAAIKRMNALIQKTSISKVKIYKYKNCTVLLKAITKEEYRMQKIIDLETNYLNEKKIKKYNYAYTIEEIEEMEKLEEMKRTWPKKLNTEPLKE